MVSTGTQWSVKKSFSRARKACGASFSNWGSPFAKMDRINSRTDPSSKRTSICAIPSNRISSITSHSISIKLGSLFSRTVEAVKHPFRSMSGSRNSSMSDDCLSADQQYDAYVEVRTVPCSNSSPSAAATCLCTPTLDIPQADQLQQEGIAEELASPLPLHLEVPPQDPAVAEYMQKHGAVVEAGMGLQDKAAQVEYSTSPKSKKYFRPSRHEDGCVCMETSGIKTRVGECGLDGKVTLSYSKYYEEPTNQEVEATAEVVSAFHALHKAVAEEQRYYNSCTPEQQRAIRASPAFRSNSYSTEDFLPCFRPNRDFTNPDSSIRKGRIYGNKDQLWLHVALPGRTLDVGLRQHVYSYAIRIAFPVKSNRPPPIPTDAQEWAWRKGLERQGNDIWLSVRVRKYYDAECKKVKKANKAAQQAARTQKRAKAWAALTAVSQ